MSTQSSWRYDIASRIRTSLLSLPELTLNCSAHSDRAESLPAAASPALIGSVTGGLLAASSVFDAFAGIVADLVQRSLGLHHRRLLRLIDAIERQWQFGSRGGRLRGPRPVCRPAPGRL